MKINHIAVSIIVVLATVFVPFIAYSQTQSDCLPPCPACIVTCPEIPACPACPDVTLNCNKDSSKWEGLWEVTTNKRLCGEVEVGPSWVKINDEVLLINKAKRFNRVESCN
jgi:hypothetical protein